MQIQEPEFYSLITNSEDALKQTRKTYQGYVAEFCCIPDLLRHMTDVAENTMFRIKQKFEGVRLTTRMYILTGKVVDEFGEVADANEEFEMPFPAEFDQSDDEVTQFKSWTLYVTKAGRASIITENQMLLYMLKRLPTEPKSWTKLKFVD